MKIENFETVAMLAVLVLLGARSGAAQASARLGLATPGRAERASASPGSVRIPLRAGVTIVTAIHDENGDLESIKRIDTVTSTAVQLEYAAEIPDGPGRVHELQRTRRIPLADLRDARIYHYRFGDLDPDVVPGTTAIQLSKAVYSDLRNTGKAAFTIEGYGDTGGMSGVAGLLGAVGDLLGGDSSAKSAKTGSAREKRSAGTLRVIPNAAPMPMLVNDRRVLLPVLHARGTLGTGADAHDADIYVLDDADNPLMLQWKIGEERLQAIKIEFPEPKAVPTIERELSDTRHASVYGIYFEFNQATIRPQSDLVLRKIAESMRRHPTWKLTVEGHTDSIGNETANRELSQKRADAVKAALVSRYGVSAWRLTTAGYGASVPKETNATLEGRARNRRVELTLQ
jgi:outer membrane protein OmpA-like peptidoglycan-associated protein